MTPVAPSFEMLNGCNALGAAGVATTPGVGVLEPTTVLVTTDQGHRYGVRVGPPPVGKGTQVEWVALPALAAGNSKVTCLCEGGPKVSALLLASCAEGCTGLSGCASDADAALGNLCSAACGLSGTASSAPSCEPVAP
jgi:hypothetical protein